MQRNRTQQNISPKQYKRAQPQTNRTYSLSSSSISTFQEQSFNKNQQSKPSMNLGSRLLVISSLAAAGMFRVVRWACIRRSHRKSPTSKGEEVKVEEQNVAGWELVPYKKNNHGENGRCENSRMGIEQKILDTGKELHMLSISMRNILADMKAIHTALSDEIYARRKQGLGCQAMVKQLNENMEQGFQQLGNAGELIGKSFRQNATVWNSHIQALQESNLILEQRVACLEAVVLQTNAPVQSMGQSSESTNGLGASSGESTGMGTEDVEV